MVDLEVVSALIFFGIVGLLIYRDRKNIEFNYGIVIKRWTRGKELIDVFVNRFRKFLPIVGNIGIVVGIISGIIMAGLLVYFDAKGIPAIAPVLPSAGGVTVPGTVSIPFWYWLFAIFPLIFVHESMHAIFARLEKIKIMSYGILLLLVLPIGAFVDPDMESTKKLPSVKKLRIFSAGSLGNYLLALFVILILFLTKFDPYSASNGVIPSLLYKDSGVSFANTLNDTPADSVHLSGIITEMDGVRISNYQDLRNFLYQTSPFTNIEIKTSTGNFNLTTFENAGVIQDGVAVCTNCSPSIDVNLTSVIIDHNRNVVEAGVLLVGSSRATGLITNSSSIQLNNYSFYLESGSTSASTNEVTILVKNSQTQSEVQRLVIHFTITQGISYLGISQASTVFRNKVFSNDIVPSWLTSAMTIWTNYFGILLIFNLGVALVNMLPMVPFDGGFVFEDIFTRIFGRKRGKQVLMASTLAILFLIIYGIYIFLTIQGFIRFLG